MGEARRLAGPESTEFRAGLEPDELTRTLGDLSFEESDAFRARRIALRDIRVSGAGATGRVFSRGVGRGPSPVLGETLVGYTPLIQGTADAEPINTVLRVLSCGPEWGGAESGHGIHTD